MLINTYCTTVLFQYVYHEGLEYVNYGIIRTPFLTIHLSPSEPRCYQVY